MILGYTYWALVWLFLLSGAAMVFMVYGKKRPDGAAFVTGLMLAVLPYFIKSSTGLVALGAAVGLIFGLGKKWQWF